jgi:hypothetical protein
MLSAVRPCDNKIISVLLSMLLCVVLNDPFQVIEDILAPHAPWAIEL